MIQEMQFYFLLELSYFFMYNLDILLFSYKINSITLFVLSSALWIVRPCIRFMMLQIDFSSDFDYQERMVDGYGGNVLLR